MNSISDDGQTKRVLITGFGPFMYLKKNPSWEGVISMNKEEMERKYNIHLFREKVEVRYNHIDTSVPELWAKLQPDLTIHVGVDDRAPCFQLETQARKCGYKVTDEELTCPVDYQNRSDGPEVLTTDLDVDVLCKEFNMSSAGLHAVKSNNAGGYICEYIYYTSLCRSTSQTLFVHVPPIYPTEIIAQGLELILAICLRHLRHLPRVPR